MGSEMVGCSNSGCNLRFPEKREAGGCRTARTSSCSRSFERSSADSSMRACLWSSHLGRTEQEHTSRSAQLSGLFVRRQCAGPLHCRLAVCAYSSSFTPHGLREFLREKQFVRGQCVTWWWHGDSLCFELLHLLKRLAQAGELRRAGGVQRGASGRVREGLSPLMSCGRTASKDTKQTEH